MLTRAVLLIVSVAIGVAPVGQRGTPIDTTAWQVYRSDQYGLEFRYPPTVALVTPGGAPTLAPLFRLWFQRAALVGSSVEQLEPPPFAVDVYANASQQGLDAWLAASGLVPPARFAREPITIGGIAGLRVTGMAQLAPNVFHFLARGPFVYRFTPLGPNGDDIVATVTFFNPPG